MRVKLKFLKKSEAVNLLGQRLSDKSMLHDMFIRYFYVWERFATRKRKPGWAEDLSARVMQLEKELMRRKLLASSEA